MSVDLVTIQAERERLKKSYLRPSTERPASSARGVHHVALLSSDVERTIRFYQELLEFPLTEIFENRDYPGSNHFFFDLGNGNLIAFFDFPGLRPRSLRRGPRRPAPSGHQRRAAALGTSQSKARRRRREVPVGERLVAVPARPRRCPDRAAGRLARAHVRLRRPLARPWVSVFASPQASGSAHRNAALGPGSARGRPDSTSGPGARACPPAPVRSRTGTPWATRSGGDRPGAGPRQAGPPSRLPVRRRLRSNAPLASPPWLPPNTISSAPTSSPWRPSGHPRFLPTRPSTKTRSERNWRRLA